MTPERIAALRHRSVICHRSCMGSPILPDELLSLLDLVERQREALRAADELRRLMRHMIPRYANSPARELALAEYEAARRRTR